MLIQSLAGRGDLVDGDVFEWVFPIGSTYWVRPRTMSNTSSRNRADS